MTTRDTHIAQRTLSLLLSAAVASVSALSGCADDQKLGGRAGEQVVIKAPLAPAPPAFAAAVEAYNQRLAFVERLRARAIVRLRYTDADGKLREEQPEGTLQFAVPDRVALTLGKAGRTVFWFGSDADRYWWLDRQDEPTVWFGKRTADGVTARANLGVNIAPWDLLRMLGVLRLDADSSGATEWSKDRSLVGITTPILARLAEVVEGSERTISAANAASPPVAGTPVDRKSQGGELASGAQSRTGTDATPNAGTSGFQRIWVDPKDWFPVRIELWSEQRELVAVAQLEGDERAEIKNRPNFGYRPRMPQRVSVNPVGSEAEIRLWLSDITDERISERAFSFDDIVRTFSVSPENLIDLDAKPMNLGTADGKMQRSR